MHFSRVTENVACESNGVELLDVTVQWELHVAFSDEDSLDITAKILSVYPLPNFAHVTWDLNPISVFPKDRCWIESVKPRLVSFDQTNEHVIIDYGQD